MKPRSYDSVVKSYNRWKSRRTGQARAPVKIKKAVVSLLGSHTLTKVAEDISVAPNTLTRWRRTYGETKCGRVKKKPSKQNSFVEITEHLPTEESIQKVTVELSKPSGEKLSFSCDLTPPIAAALAREFFKK